MLLKQWNQYVVDHWIQIRGEVKQLKLENLYQELVAMALYPTICADLSLDLLKTHPQGQGIYEGVTAKIKPSKPQSKAATSDTATQSSQSQTSTKSTVVPAKSDLAEIVKAICNQVGTDGDLRSDLNWLVIETGVMTGALQATDRGQAFCDEVLTYLQQHQREPSPLGVYARMIRAGQNVVIAGRDAHIINDYYDGSKTELKAYLARVRAECNQTDQLFEGTNEVTPSLRLHQLYTPIDVWTQEAIKDLDEMGEQAIHQRSIEQDLNHLRYTALEAVATLPRLVISGGAGSGKSSLVRFIATCLAYACDPEAETTDQFNGLEMLGPAWVHGAILPVYVNLRHFASSDAFKKATDRRSAQTLLDFVGGRYKAFNKELKAYLTNTKLPFDGTILLLDGLDEVYNEADRTDLKYVIENWVYQFPRCRVLVTTRAYAYKNNVVWRLSNKFEVTRLAPYTWQQLQSYIKNWYTNAAHVRPHAFGGAEVAAARSDHLAKELISTILQSRGLWSLARQPLLLALMVLIHKENTRLPSNKAQLYEQTIQLLFRWRPVLADDALVDKIADLNWNRVRQGLQLVAFDLQRDHAPYDKLRGHIERKALLDRLMEQQQMGNGLGAAIEDVLKYLATRNGILVSGPNTTYRFLHLSLQEYLAACALIEQFDECAMPGDLPKPEGALWSFPSNLVALVKADAFRWREIALFAGAILANNRGQDTRWSLIENMLPKEPKSVLAEGEVHAIHIAAEIWSTSWLKSRLPTQDLIRSNLIKYLEMIASDERLDPPEITRVAQILGQIQTDM